MAGLGDGMTPKVKLSDALIQNLAVGKVYRDHKGGTVSGMDFTYDGQFLVTYLHEEVQTALRAQDNSVNVYSCEKASRVRHLRCEKYGVALLRFLHNDRDCAVAASRNEVSPHPYEAHSVQFSPCGKYLLVRTPWSQMVLVDAFDGELICEYPVQEQGRVPKQFPTQLALRKRLALCTSWRATQPCQGERAGTQPMLWSSLQLKPWLGGYQTRVHRQLERHEI
eukprot:Skav218859  [mRNA]  locus=scaffold2827:71843:82223:- [translate_table: standard]